MQDRQREGRRFTRASLGDAEQIPAFDKKGYRLNLNGSRFEVFLGFEGTPQRLGKAE